MPTPLETIDAKVIRRYQSILREREREIRTRLESRLSRLAAKGQDTKAFKAAYRKELSAIDNEIRDMARLLKRDLKTVTIDEITKEHNKFLKRQLPITTSQGVDRLKNLLTAEFDNTFGTVWLNRIDEIAKGAGFEIKRSMNQMLDAVNQQIRTGQISQLGVDDVARRIRVNAFGLTRPSDKKQRLVQESINYQLQTIVRTASSQIDTAAKVAYAAKDDDIVAYKVLIGPGPDNADICENTYGGSPGSSVIIPKDEFARPPLHPNCNCLIQGYVRKDDKKGVAQAAQYKADLKDNKFQRKMVNAAKKNDMAAVQDANKQLRKEQKAS